MIHLDGLIQQRHRLARKHVGDKVGAAYRRGDMIEKRHKLMVDWAAFADA